MSIRNIGNTYGPAVPATRATPAPGTGEGATPATPAAPAARAARSDSVQISDAGRALAGTEGGERTGSASAERLAELRQKVLEGAYNSVQVVDQVAQRILKSGDV
ncbi:flagellar biosynthesis anti-sigma factor FlgM [Roseisolibacter sp. H3M3-2]|uniref:flagellar biosynthesis anti-sigma factor FlgM n=1 Tax=Roseisolibacter sp. H3M3-2 TaxID=3031323 RepID=UPI0023DB3B85|nr:flagellar biosynthesis anti-sigma factor FlgM [Roseisolibacter sp. H3M3-2]MDF1506162.1 flagellar biosynthesis anti-sigma factor FlgM [Roseisolibacter sp. H3M3-2]